MKPQFGLQDDPGGGVITAIEMEKTPLMKRAAVYLDDRPTVYARERDVAPRNVGDFVSNRTLTAWQRRYEDRGAYLQAIRYLGPRDRSAREVRQHLDRKGWPAAACGHAIDKLKEEGYVDDRKFAAAWVASRGRTAPRSRMAAIQELQHKGIARETILAVVETMDEEVLALACARKKTRQWLRYADDQRKQRIVAYLQRKGFPYAACRKAAQDLTAPWPDV